MKKLLALFLAMLMLTGCVSQELATLPTPSTSPVEDNTSIEFDGLDDPALLSYVEDTVYAELIATLNNEGYFVENVQAKYISKEYLEEVAYNSQANIYFGYNLDDLNAIFQGERYVFTLGEDGQTTVQAFEAYDDIYAQILHNVTVGTGVILLCVTASVVSAGVGAPAVSMIFAASAMSGTVMSLSSAALGGIAAGIITGIQTKDFDRALQAAAVAGSESFKWGAITGAITGGVGEAIALKGATLNGLSMNEAAKIQMDSGYPLDVIKQFHTMDEYQAFKNANLKSTMVNNKTALVKTDIDLTRVDSKGRTNLQRMKNGLAPLDADGNSYELHHVGQKKDGTLAILTQAEHDNPHLHGYLQRTEAHAAGTNWDAERKAFWKAFAELVR